LVSLGVAAALCTAASSASAQAVVVNGYFTNVYVYKPSFDGETWEQHIAGLRTNANSFSRKNIDAFTRDIMRSTWPSYFDPLAAYTTSVFGLDTKYIHPPEFFGSGFALQRCVAAALHDAHNGVVQWDTVKTLANCHDSGMDPSPQINLIFSPDIQLGQFDFFNRHQPEMCANSQVNGYHAWGEGVPNFTVLPTSTVCQQDFSVFSTTLTHEVVELLTDPGGAGYFANFPDYSHEAADLCGNPEVTVVDGFTLARYVGGPDPPFVAGLPVPGCQPRLDSPLGSESQTWILGQASPLIRFTDHAHTLTLGMPAGRVTTDALLTQAIVVIQTGSDDLRGGEHAGDNADVTLTFSTGSVVTTNVNRGFRWGDHTTHSAILNLPSPKPKVSDITGVTISTNFGGGLGHDNWNVDKVALVVAFPTGSATTGPIPPPPIVHDWLIRSELPLIRFSEHVHDLTLPLDPQDVRADIGRMVTSLNLIISTGNDDLRGGSNPGDNCDVTIQLASGPPIVIKNVNGGAKWDSWTNHTVSIPLPPTGLRGGDVVSIALHTGFGGLFPDRWNVEQVILEATIAPPGCDGCPTFSSIASGCKVDRPNVLSVDAAHGTVAFRRGHSGHAKLTCPVPAAVAGSEPLSPVGFSQMSVTLYNEHGFEGGVNHCSVTADLLRSNLDNNEAGADIATLTSTNRALSGRAVLSVPVAPLDLSKSYYWIDIDVFRDSPTAACNPTVVGTYLQ
jgi:hypothetical protein